MSDENQTINEKNGRTMFAFGLVSGMMLILLVNSFMGVSYGRGGINLGDSATPTPGGVVTEPTVKTATKLSEAPSKDDHIRGDLKKAKVVIVEYSDFECPFCSKAYPTMKAIEEKYGEQVAIVYRHFPLSFHPQAMPAALASECASEQGKFWEYHDALFENQSLLATEYYSKLAGDLGLDTKKFDSCFSSKKYQSVVSADQASGSASGVNGTPATFINGTLVTGSNGQSVGAAPLATFTAIIDAELAK